MKILDFGKYVDLEIFFDQGTRRGLKDDPDRRKRFFDDKKYIDIQKYNSSERRQKFAHFFRHVKILRKLNFTNISIKII